MPGINSSTSSVLRGALMARSIAEIGVTSADDVSRLRELDVVPVTITCSSAPPTLPADGFCALSGGAVWAIAAGPQMSNAATETFLFRPLLRLKGGCRDCAGIMVDLDAANTELTAALSARFLKTRMRLPPSQRRLVIGAMRRHDSNPRRHEGASGSGRVCCRG